MIAFFPLNICDIMSSDINLLAAKIESLKDVASSREYMEKQLSEVIAGRRKPSTHTWHMESKPIPVIKNLYELLNNSTIGEFETQIQ